MSEVPAQPSDPPAQGDAAGEGKVFGFDPSAKLQRIGRPRPAADVLEAHLGAAAAENGAKATVSKFRLDDLPVDGPGSRGGEPRAGKGVVGRKRPRESDKELEEVDGGEAADTMEAQGNGEEVKTNGEEGVSGEEGMTNGEEGMTNGEEAKPDGEEIKKESGNGHGYGQLPPIQVQSVPAGQPGEGQAGQAGQVAQVGQVGQVGQAGQVVQAGLPQVGYPQVGQPLQMGQMPYHGQPLQPGLSPGMMPLGSLPMPGTGMPMPGMPPQMMYGPMPEGWDAQTAEEKKLTLSFKFQTSRTTIVREKNRITRTFPGPLVGVHFDLYDNNVIKAKVNEDAAAEKLAFGVPLEPAPHAADIIQIISYITKFGSFLNCGIFGPQDLEEGLGLNGEDVLPEVEQLFASLLTLTLNRKKPVVPLQYRLAITELRGQLHVLGMPPEWRDDTHVLSARKIDIDPVLDRVDPTVPAASDMFDYSAPGLHENPFMDKALEEQGLAGISPADRVIMLRCLTTWSLTASNELKSYLVDVVNGQDIPGERDTLYATRSILRGFGPTQDLKKELEGKLAKRLKKAKADESVYRYIDPTSDPNVHPMALRLNEFLVGDIGLHIGRFYLVRMGDANGGFISSIEKMRKAAAERPAKATRTRFRLYVEDVHLMLTDSLQEYGVEFDGDKTVDPKVTAKDLEYWFCVASNYEELDRFIKVLELKLGMGESEGLLQLSVAFKPLLYLYQYLSLVNQIFREDRRR